MTKADYKPDTFTFISYLSRAPGIRVLSFHGGTKAQRRQSLAKIHRRGGVALTSYGMLVSNADTLAEKDGRDFIWVRKGGRRS